MLPPVWIWMRRVPRFSANVHRYAQYSYTNHARRGFVVKILAKVEMLKEIQDRARVLICRTFGMFVFFNHIVGCSVSCQGGGRVPVRGRVMRPAKAPHLLRFFTEARSGAWAI